MSMLKLKNNCLWEYPSQLRTDTYLAPTLWNSTPSSILAWRIPWTKEPGRQSLTWYSDWAHTHAVEDTNGAAKWYKNLLEKNLECVWQKRTNTYREGQKHQGICTSHGMKFPEGRCWWSSVRERPLQVSHQEVLKEEEEPELRSKSRA